MEIGTGLRMPTVLMKWGLIRPRLTLTQRYMPTIAYVTLGLTPYASQYGVGWGALDAVIERTISCA